MSICCGKIALSVRSKRLKRARIVLRQLTPFVVHWLGKHRHRQAEMVTDFIEQIQSRDMLVRTIALWKSRVPLTQIVAVQRGVRGWLMVRQAQKEFLLTQWEKLEQLEASGKVQKAAGFVIKEFRSENVVPIRIKEMMLSENIKSRAKDHAKRTQAWVESCETLKAKRAALLKDDPLAQPPPLCFPPKPRFRLPLSVEELQTLIQSAEKKRFRWERLSKEAKQRSKPNAGFLNVPMN